MKKLKLKMQELNTPEVLTRQQLKNVLGGAVGDITTTIKKAVCVADSRCGGGDSSPWSTDCKVNTTLNMCACPSALASWSNCTDIPA